VWALGGEKLAGGLKYGAGAVYGIGIAAPQGARTQLDAERDLGRQSLQQGGERQHAFAGQGTVVAGFLQQCGMIFAGPMRRWCIAELGIAQPCRWQRRDIGRAVAGAVEMQWIDEHRGGGRGRGGDDPARRIERGHG
jgi:hypothetical protein